MTKKINIKNRKAGFKFKLMDEYTAGIVLNGTEIKSLREGKASIAEGFCEFNDKNELFVVNINIQEYRYGNNYNHKPKAIRKLLLNKSELKKLKKEVNNSGITIIPTSLYINEKGLAKMKISLAKGKKLFDKREILKKRDIEKKLNKVKKIFLNKTKKN